MKCSSFFRSLIPVAAGVIPAAAVCLYFGLKWGQQDSEDTAPAVEQSPAPQTEQPAVEQPSDPQPVEPAVEQPTEPQPVKLSVEEEVAVIFDSLSNMSPHSVPDMVQAAQKGDMESLKKLLAEGADINVKDVAFYTPLMAAIYSGKTEAALYLIEQKADINAQDHFGVTPLMLAALYNNMEVATKLLEAGANPEICDRWNNSARQYAFDSSAEMKQLFEKK